MLPTTTAGSLPKPGWLAETGKIWPAWRASGAELEQAKRDAALVKDFGPARTRFADAVMADADGGLPPERAVKLATQRLGQPGPSEEEVTESVGGDGNSPDKQAIGEGSAKGESGDATTGATGATNSPADPNFPTIDDADHATATPNATQCAVSTRRGVTSPVDVTRTGPNRSTVSAPRFASE